MPIDEFISLYLSPFLQKACRENKTLYLLGDFNINESQDISSFLDLLGSHLILPQILLPTRITVSSKTLIDNIFTTTDGSSSIAGNILYNISDHLVLVETLIPTQTGQNLIEKILF